MEPLQVHYVDLGVPRVTELRSDLAIGRTEGNDLILNHPSVSRKHARIEDRNGNWWIVDLKSTFSADVDTASYAFVRRMLASGRLPPPFTSAGLKKRPIRA